MSKTTRKTCKTDEELKDLNIDITAYHQCFFDLFDSILMQEFIDLKMLKYDADNITNAIYKHSSPRYGYARCQRIVDYFEIDAQKDCPARYIDLRDDFKSQQEALLDPSKYDCEQVLQKQSDYYDTCIHRGWVDIQNHVLFDLFFYLGYSTLLAKLKPDSGVIEGIQNRLEAIQDLRGDEGIDSGEYAFLHPVEHRVFTEIEFERLFVMLMGEVPFDIMRDYLNTRNKTFTYPDMDDAVRFE